MSKIRVVVISDDSAAHTGFGTVVRNLFGTLQYDHADKIDLLCIGCYPMQVDKKHPRRVPTVLTAGAGPDEHGIVTLQKIVKAQGWPDIIFLLGDWWYWRHDLLNDDWKARNKCLSSVWYYAPVDAVQLTEHALPAYCSADRLIAMSPFGQQELLRCTGREDIVTMPHGFDPKTCHFRRKARSKRTVFGVVSRNGDRKNLWAILQAFLDLKLEAPTSFPFDASKHKLELRLHVPLGDFAGGDLAAFVKHICAERGISEREAGISWSSGVSITQNKERNAASVSGVTDKAMGDFYRRSIDCLVSAGREGFGLPILEARACGCDIIVPDYSAPHSMGYKDAWSFHCPTKRVDGDAYSVLDIVPDVGALADAMASIATRRKLFGGPEHPLPGPTWQHSADQLFDLLSTHKKPLALQQQADVAALARTPFVQLRPILQKWIAYVMPESAGDVLLSSAVTHALRKKHPDCKTMFITRPQFRDIVSGCPWVDGIEDFNKELHSNYDLASRLFDAYYTPYMRTQVAGDWVQGGYGQQLAETYASACGVQLGDYYVPEDLSGADPSGMVCLHVGSGTGQHSARKYSRWAEVVSALARAGHGVVQVGAANDMDVPGVEIDLRGSTTYPQLFRILRVSKLHMGIDSMPMHAACILGIPTVAIFGNTFPHLTGPHENLKGTEFRPVFHSVEPTERPCGRPCHLLECPAKKDWNCLESLDPEYIAQEVIRIIGGKI